jgi:hypothetical protein
MVGCMLLKMRSSRSCEKPFSPSSSSSSPPFRGSGLCFLSGMFLALLNISSAVP